MCTDVSKTEVYDVIYYYSTKIENNNSIEPVPRYQNTQHKNGGIVLKEPVQDVKIHNTKVEKINL